MYEVEFPDGMIVRVPTLPDIVRLERLCKGHPVKPCPAHLPGAQRALDEAEPDWRAIELTLDTWEARASLKRARVETLGDLADVLVLGRVFRALSFFRSLRRFFRDDTRLCRLVFALFDESEIPAVRVVKAEPLPWPYDLADMREEEPEGDHLAEDLAELGITEEGVGPNPFA